jgi:CMP-N,N'-diacetyllegionaminic acid synthase
MCRFCGRPSWRETTRRICRLFSTRSSGSNITPRTRRTPQPTSPLRRADDIRNAIDLFRESGADSVVSVSEVPAHYNPMRTLGVDDRGFARLFVTGEPVRTRINRRQDMPTAWTMNGAIYLCRTALVTGSEPSLYGERTAAYVMTSPFGISIDDEHDWMEAERALRSGGRDRQS